MLVPAWRFLSKTGLYNSQSYIIHIVQVIIYTLQNINHGIFNRNIIINRGFWDLFSAPWAGSCRSSQTGAEDGLGREVRKLAIPYMPNWTQEWFKYNFWKISSAKMLLIDTSSSLWALWFVVTSSQLRFAATRRVFRIMEKEWFHLRVLFDDFDPTKLMNDDSWSKKIFRNALEIFRCFDPFSFRIFRLIRSAGAYRDAPTCRTSVSRWG